MIEGLSIALVPAAPGAPSGQSNSASGSAAHTSIIPMPTPTAATIAILLSNRVFIHRLLNRCYPYFVGDSATAEARTGSFFTGMRPSEM